MNSMCSQCHELVERSYRSCPACGADLRVQVPHLVDLTEHEIDLERERADLLAAVVAGSDDTPTHTPRRWGVGTPSMLELELAPVRIGRFTSTDDVLPSGPAPKRGWLRR